MSVICPNCGTENDRGGMHCTHCGSYLDPVPRKRMTWLGILAIIFFALPLLAYGSCLTLIGVMAPGGISPKPEPFDLFFGPVCLALAGLIVYYAVKSMKPRSK